MAINTDIAAIGPCSVPRCAKPATVHVLLGERPRQVAGTVCAHCAEVTLRAAFLLEIIGA
ncbi:MAG: hypothetical protein M3083_00715 [Actinomycetota bacterium]|nr:hypothetical protein [Actinomycetota bacterium]